MTKRFKPKNVADATKWWTEQSKAGKTVYWDGVAKEMIATDEADLRSMNTKDLSKVARIWSEADLSRMMKSIWKDVPSSRTGATQQAYLFEDLPSVEIPDTWINPKRKPKIERSAAMIRCFGELYRKVPKK